MEAGLMEILNNFAFPVAIVVILMLFVAKLLKSYREDTNAQKEEMKELSKQYHNDYCQFVEALNNNTTAINSMNKLIEKIYDRKED